MLVAAARAFALVVALVLVAPSLAQDEPSGATPPAASEPTLDDARQMQAAGAVLATPTVAEWLGPLAPVALSPFFGVACLSGLSLLMERGVVPENALLARAGPLKNGAVFIVLSLLAIATSLPRLTKLSKPLVQGLDFVETWSALVIVVTLKVLATPSAEDDATVALLAGVFASSGGFLMTALGAVNMLVIATVRFVFEVLVWLSPIPLVDAAFEACKKTVCGGLMAVYAFHPAAALLLNALLFVLALLASRWAWRAARCFQALLVGPVLARLGRRPRADVGVLHAYAAGEVGPFASRQHVIVTREGESLRLSARRLWRSPLVLDVPVDVAELDEGWLKHELRVGGHQLAVSRAWDADLEERCVALGLRRTDRPAGSSPDGSTRSERGSALAAEMRSL